MPDLHPGIDQCSPWIILARMPGAALAEPARRAISTIGHRSEPPIGSCRFVLMLSALLRAAFSVSAFLLNKLRRCRAPQHQTKVVVGQDPWPRPFRATSCEARSLRFSFRGFSFFDFDFCGAARCRMFPGKRGRMSVGMGWRWA